MNNWEFCRTIKNPNYGLVCTLLSEGLGRREPSVLLTRVEEIDSDIALFYIKFLGNLSRLKHV